MPLPETIVSVYDHQKRMRFPFTSHPGLSDNLLRDTDSGLELDPGHGNRIPHAGNNFVLYPRHQTQHSKAECKRNIFPASFPVDWTSTTFVFGTSKEGVAKTQTKTPGPCGSWRFFIAKNTLPCYTNFYEPTLYITAPHIFSIAGK